MHRRANGKTQNYTTPTGENLGDLECHGDFLDTEWHDS